MTMRYAGGQFGGIALGTVVTIAGYHLMRRLAPRDVTPPEAREETPDRAAER